MPVTMWTVLLCLLSAHSALSNNAFKNITEERNELLRKEFDMMLGSDIVLSDTEQKANEIIMNLKFKELDQAFHHPQLFNLSKHFFEYKDVVRNFELFKLIKEMPKGAVLHAHDTGFLGADYLLNITYKPDLFVCFEEDNMHLLFAEEIPKTSCETQWQLLRDARYSFGNVEKFDAKLLEHFTIVTDDPDIVYTDINAVWNRFQKYFIVTGAMLCYKPVWEQYFYDTLMALRDDNVMYAEIRSVLPPLYDLKGNTYDAVATAESYKKVLDEFMHDYPDFYGAKLIYAPLRKVDKKTVTEYIKIAKEIKRKLPDFLAGFDLVGQEDMGAPTKDFLPELFEAKDELDFFFHAGETNWYGTSSDENIVDAIVLGSKRIGHAYALIKHPVLINEIKERDIALEVNVVSNAVLKLVSDVRNHPLATFLALDLPVVISSDDPGAWGADPLSHDFYVAFVGVASRNADLRLLKKLALNSLYYSAIPNKDKIIHEFEIRWIRFIDSVVRDKW